MVDGLNSSTYSPSDLVAGEYQRTQRVVTLTGGAALLEGALLGRTNVGAAVAGALVPVTNANGTISGVSAGAAAKVGTYRIVCIEPAANVGTFAVFDPDGVEVGTAVVGVAFAGPINFTLNDGANDFVAGDTFPVAVAAGTEKFKLSLAAATDGSQEPCAILSQDADPSGGDKQVSVYLTGEFNAAKVTFGTGHTKASTLWGLSQKNIYLRDTVGA